MPLITKPNYNQIFASQAPEQDKPAVFNNYPEGWGPESRPNNGKPTIKGFNYLQQTSDLKNLWILQNGACLPYDESIEYAEGATVLKDGELQQWKGGEWVQEASSQSSFSALIVADLLEVKNPKPYQKKYVSSVGAWYTYYPDTNQVPNGVTVVGKWVMDTQPAYYASWFCEAESGTDQLTPLQTGHDYATLKNKPFIIDIKVDINPTIRDSRLYGLTIRSNSVTKFEKGGEIRQLSTNVDIYYIIYIQDIENFEIWNPVVRGDRRSHLTTTGEWGYGIAIYQCKDGYIHRPRVYDCWGDGICIARRSGVLEGLRPTDVTIFEPHIDGVRRNGITLSAGERVNVVRPYITKVGDYDGVIGAWPKSAIDVEPEQVQGAVLSSVKDCRFIDTTIYDVYAGIYLYFFANGSDQSLYFEGITKIEKSSNNSFGFFHGGSDCTGLVHFDHIHVKTVGYIGAAHAWNGASELYCVVDKLTVSDPLFTFIYTLNGAFVEKQLGNIVFNNIEGDVNFRLNSSLSEIQQYSDGNIYRKSAGSKARLTQLFQTIPPQPSADFFMDGEYTHTTGGDRATRRILVNTIWQDPSVDTIKTYMLSANDYRRVKVGLSGNTATIGEGCNISGLNLLIDGVAKTKAQCLTLGGWLEFQNVSGGRTIIYNSYGDWIFS